MKAHTLMHSVGESSVVRGTLTSIPVITPPPLPPIQPLLTPAVLLLLIVTLMASIHLVSDYAKIATVHENRRSMVFAVGHALSQVVRHPLQAFGLIGVMFLAGAVLQTFLFLVLPDVRNATAQ